MKKTFGELNCPIEEEGSNGVVKLDASLSVETVSRQIHELREKRRKCRRLLALAKLRAEPKKLLIAASVLLALSLFLFFFSLSLLNTSFVFPIVFAVLCEICIALFGFALVRKRKAGEKYAPLIARYAKEIAELDALLARYEKAIEDLTKF